MHSELTAKVETLGRLASDRGVAWRQEARSLPSGDGFALVGLLACRLGIPLSRALDPHASEADLRALALRDPW